MKIVYAALRWDYGKPEQGDSFEHQTFFAALRSMGHELLYFDFHELAQEHGRDRMNRRLWELVQTEKPDLLFCVLFGDELDSRVVRRISEETSTTTLNWFCDDHWRFYDYSRRWTPCFNWVVTTVSPEVAPYEELGLTNVIRSQWGCNTHLYRKPDAELPLEHGVTFVGMAHGNRAQTIEGLRRAGVEVRTWGAGWPEGRLTIEEMVRVFYQSRVNLNLSNASVTVAQAMRRAPRLARARSAVQRVPGGGRLLAVSRRAWRHLPFISTGERYIPQLKARTFEVPGCGGFLLTQEAPELERYLEPGREIGTFRGLDDLVHAVRLYLGDEDLRRRVAAAGYDRVTREHSYERRFAQIFARIGLGGETA